MNSLLDPFPFSLPQFPSKKTPMNPATKTNRERRWRKRWEEEKKDNDKETNKQTKKWTPFFPTKEIEKQESEHDILAGESLRYCCFYTQKVGRRERGREGGLGGEQNGDSAHGIIAFATQERGLAWLVEGCWTKERERGEICWEKKLKMIYSSR